jgi:hypothetical protein
VYDQSTGNLYYDADGGNSGNRTLVVTLTASGTVDASDMRLGL